MQRPDNTRGAEVEHSEWRRRLVGEFVERMNRPKRVTVEMRVAVTNDSLNRCERFLGIPFVLKQ
jgi:hypothetical protein